MNEPDILRGHFDEYDLSHVLQAVSIGRQYVAVELDAEPGTRGTIFTKSGRIIGARSNDSSGLEAFFRLMEAPTGYFRVYRVPPPEDPPRPLGQIHELLVEVRRRRGPTDAQREPSEAPSAAPIPAGARPLPSLASSSTRPVRSGGSVAPITAPARAVPEAPSIALSVAPSVALSVAPSVAHEPPPVARVAPPPASAPSRVAPPVAAVPARVAPTPRAPTPMPPTLPPTPPAPPRAPTPPSPTPPSPSRAPTPPAQAVRAAPPRHAAPPAAFPPVLAISSPKGGVGKTTIALNLALSLGRRGHRTVLIDGDVNGDIMSSIDARSRPRAGAYDVLLGEATLEDCLLRTSIDELRLLPATGPELPDAALLGGDLSDAWRALFDRLRRDTDVIVLDTAAGTFGTTHHQLRAATHVVGVLQAESVAHRSFDVFTRSLNTLPDDERPVVLGVVLNMLQTGEAASVEVLRAACSELPPAWLFDVTIPRHPAFLRASSDGVPLGLVDERNPPAVAWLFDGLAGEVAERLALLTPQERRPRRLLL